MRVGALARMYGRSLGPSSTQCAQLCALRCRLYAPLPVASQLLLTATRESLVALPALVTCGVETREQASLRPLIALDGPPP